MKKFLFTIGTSINKPLILGASLLCSAVVIVSAILLVPKDSKPSNQNSVLGSSSSELSAGDTTPEETPGDTPPTESSEVTETSPEETESSSSETTIKVTYTTLPEYTTIPIEEISTTSDNSSKDEVMGGGDDIDEDEIYGDDEVYDGEDEVPTVKETTTAETTTKETTTKETTTKETTTKETTTKETTTKETTTKETTTKETTTKETTTKETTTEPTTTESVTKDTTTEEMTTTGESTESSTDETSSDSTTETTTEEITTEEVTTEEPTTLPSENVYKRPDDYVLEVSYGCDVSKWQGDIDWAKAKAAGVDFVMIKLGGRSVDAEGAIYMDSKFKQNIQGAIENDVKVGIYFFSQAITIQEAIEEASYCINILKDYEIDYPVCFDFEQGNAASGRRTYLAMADGTLTKQLLTEISCAFCNTLEAAGYDSMIYASRSSWTSSRWDGDFLNENYRTWLAVWYKTTSDMIPTFGTGNTDGQNTFKSKFYNWIPTLKIDGTQSQFLMWQYSDSGRIDGINANVDLDMCFYIPEEYEGYVCPMNINVTNNTFHTVVGTTVDIMSGVTGTNTVSKDKTSSIKYKITNVLGAEVELEDAVKHSGKYTITYSITDFTWCVRYNYATLNVYDTEEEMNQATTTEAVSTEDTSTEATASETSDEATSSEMTTISEVTLTTVALNSISNKYWLNSFNP